MGARLPGIRLACTNVIPHARGLGSSSAAIVAGVCAARGLVAGGSLLMDDDAVFALAADLEGHPDNVAPALLGGFVISGQSDDAVWAEKAPLHPSVSAVVFVPPHGVRTEVARGLLPASVPHADAAANTGRAALLVAALGGHTSLLLRATEDFLHQRARGPAMPESLALMESLRARGVPAAISGAGPTVLAFATSYDEVNALVGAGPDGWSTIVQSVGGPGARVLM
jgi:homoserine kinase